MNLMGVERTTIDEHAVEGEVSVLIEVSLIGESTKRFPDAVEFRRRVLEVVKDYNKFQQNTEK